MKRIVSHVLAASWVVLVSSLPSHPCQADIFVSTNSRGGPDAVQQFTDSGAFVKTFVAAGSGGLANANNLHFGPNGNLYVATSNGVKIYSGATGQYIQDFTSSPVSDFVFDPAGNMYAVDNAAVLKFDQQGILLQTFSAGVSTPQGIIFNSDGRLLITNAYAGAYRNTITSLDPSDGSFTTFATGLGEPIGIATGPDGQFYVANYTFATTYGGTNPDTIQVVAASGGSSTTWNQGGGLFGATYLAIDANKLFAASFYNSTVQVFDIATGASSGGFNVPNTTGGTEGANGITYRNLRADFNGDFTLDITDYLILSQHLHEDVSALPLEQTFELGDLNADRRINGLDFVGFRADYEAIYGSGSFVALLASVPEPTAGSLAAMALVSSTCYRRRRR